MNDEILIELGDVSESTMGPVGGENESIQFPNLEP